MAFANHNRSIVDIFRDVFAQLTSLLHKEAQLARAELSENVSRATLGLGLIVGGAVLLIPALVILLEAAVAAWSKTECAQRRPPVSLAAALWCSELFWSPSVYPDSA
jgi:uncharacterized membrane protein YqjE